MEMRKILSFKFFIPKNSKGDFIVSFIILIPLIIFLIQDLIIRSEIEDLSRQEVKNFNQIPKQLKDKIQKFKNQAIIHNVDVENLKKIRYVILPEKYKKRGSCNLENKIVKVSKEAPLLVLYHELGHCLYKLDHDFLDYKSIMFFDNLDNFEMTENKICKYFNKVKSLR